MTSRILPLAAPTLSAKSAPGGRDGGNGGPGARRGGSGDVHWARLKDDPSLHLWRADKLSYWLSTCRAAVSKDARMAILAQILRAEPAQTWT